MLDAFKPLRDEERKYGVLVREDWMESPDDVIATGSHQYLTYEERARLLRERTYRPTRES